MASRSREVVRLPRHGGEAGLFHPLVGGGKFVSSFVLPLKWLFHLSSAVSCASALSSIIALFLLVGFFRLFSFL